MKLALMLNLFLSTLALSTPTPATYSSKSAYLSHLSKTNPTLPAGFTAHTSSLTFVPVEAPTLGELPMKLTAIVPPKDSEYAYVLTKNVLCGAPITYIKEMKGERLTSGIIINNKISNVLPSGNGLDSISSLESQFRESFNTPTGHIIPGSTGVIGWSLPVPSMLTSLKTLPQTLSLSPLELASSILTTDRYPKIRSSKNILALGKGAGMIEPNMGTMLVYILTDKKTKNMQSILKSVVDRTFNCITVDGDESTSDQVVLVSSGVSGEISEKDFEKELEGVCKELSRDIVRNGEGTGHVINVRIEGFEGKDEEARELGKAVVNSPLFKTAVAGNDPNVGRVAAKVGSWCGKNNFPCTGLRMTLGGVEIFKNGSFQMDAKKEEELSEYMEECGFGEKVDYMEHEREVELEIIFEGGEGKAEVWGSDLTKEYVAVNADYRS